MMIVVSKNARVGPRVLLTFFFYFLLILHFFHVLKKACFVRLRGVKKCQFTEKSATTKATTNDVTVTLVE